MGGGDASTGGGAGGGTPEDFVGPDGGTVSHLYFAVIGDTRPANPDDTAHYPTPIITKIYEDLAAMNPKPQFVVTTGDYQFASPSGNAGPTQLGLYATARAAYSGPVLAAMGNHECTGATASNCAGVTSGNHNYATFLSMMVEPLGQTTPYYSVPINDSAGAWTAKVVITACNSWDATQKAWLESTLATPTTYTFVVRHEPAGTSCPCMSDMTAILAQYPYTMMIVGHSHTYSATPSSRELLVGNGGAPTSTTLGYAIVEQKPMGAFSATRYDYATAAPIETANFQ
jgi:hypothetical protein